VEKFSTQKNFKKGRDGMRKITIVFIFFVCLLVAGICILQSDLGGEYYYYASGRLMMDDVEWEQFKIDLYNDGDVDLKDVEVLNAGGDKLVQFDDLRVSEDFKYGEVIEVFSKRCSSPWAWMEVIFIPVGTVGVVVSGLSRKFPED
jgi:hypothetical protein